MQFDFQMGLIVGGLFAAAVVVVMIAMLRIKRGQVSDLEKKVEQLKSDLRTAFEAARKDLKDAILETCIEVGSYYNDPKMVLSISEEKDAGAAERVANMNKAVCKLHVKKLELAIANQSGDSEVIGLKGYMENIANSNFLFELGRLMQLQQRKIIDQPIVID